MRSWRLSYCLPLLCVCLLALGLFALVHGPHSAGAQTTLAAPCGPAALKGTYSFLTTGFGPVIPQALLQTPVAVTGADPAVGGLMPLHAIGHVRFKSDGTNVGYIHENVGGALEGQVPFEGKVTDFQAGPHGEGCWAIWELQDRHHLPVFANEPPHFFRIALGKGRFEFMTFGGGPGPAVLSGFATKTD
jgi:hypothetical protein